MDQYNSTTSPPPSVVNEDQDHYYDYEDGEEIRQIWSPAFVVFAYLLAFLSAYGAVHLLDHGLWFFRSKELQKKAIIKYPNLYAAILLGLGTVWSMHFVSLLLFLLSFSCGDISRDFHSLCDVRLECLPWHSRAFRSATTGESP